MLILFSTLRKENDRYCVNAYMYIMCLISWFVFVARQIS